MSGPKSKYKSSEYKSLVLVAYCGRIIPLEAHNKQQKPILHFCTECSTEWRMSSSKVLTPNGAKKSTFKCPNCSALRSSSSDMSKDMFLAILEDISRTEGQPLLRLKGEYIDQHTPVTVLCSCCGKSRVAAPEKICNLKYLCTCFGGSAKDLKNSKRLRCLHKDASMSVAELSAVSGYSETSIRSLGYKEGWLKSKSRRFKADPKHRLQSIISGSLDKTQRLYIKNAKRLMLELDTSRHSKSINSVMPLQLAYVLGPVDLDIVCHPANIIASDDDSKLHDPILDVETLRTRISKFERKHGKVVFPEEFQYRYTKKNIDTPRTNLRVLGFDPGVSSFGCFAGLVSGEDNVSSVEALESSMLINPFVSIETLGEDMLRFRAEMMSYIEEYRPHVIVAERFMSRGLKGATIELINLMLGVLSSTVYEYQQKGFDIDLKLIMPASWKNRVNKIVKLDNLYTVCRKRGIVDHKLDSALMSLYSFPTGKNPYEFLSNRQARNNFLNSLLKAQTTSE